MVPPDSSRALMALFQLAGLPILIADAMVSGSGTTSPLHDGRSALRLEAHHPRAHEPVHSLMYASWKPSQYAVMLPALPTGMKT